MIMTPKNNNDDIKKSVELKKIHRDNLVKNVLNRKEIISNRGNRIPAPPYAQGTYDKYGLPLQKKVRYFYKKVFSNSATYFIIEGGTRGGKDVLALNAWVKVLMTSKERMHLALGVSLEHVIKTVYDSNGFGLKYLIPHGEFVRDSEAGAGNRGVFKFLNAYGEEREVHFYGNFKKDDHSKFQGYTFGTVYINEGILQHINGINEARQRIATSKDSKIFITQNPVGTSHKLYSEFEKGFILTEEEIKFIEHIKRNPDVVKAWKKFVLEQELFVKETINIFTQDLLTKLKKKNIEEFSELEKQKYERDKFEIEIDLKYGSEVINENGDRNIVHGLYSKPIDHFVCIPDELRFDDNKLENASMHKIMSYDRGYSNPNGVVNGYDYVYMHFTMWNNAGMTKMQINDAIKSYDKSSSTYKQRILGERISSDGVLFPEFSDYNILTNPIDFYELNPNTLRVIAIDPGAAHATAIVDAEVDLVNGTIYVLGEAKVDLSDLGDESRSYPKLEEELIGVIRKRKKRKMPDMLIIDPSATFLIGHFTRRGYNVFRGNNKTQSAKSKDLTFGDKTVKKGTKGVDLIRDGLFRLKFMFHESCVETINEMRNVSVKFNETTGEDEIIKINDDMFDAFKYIANTSGINPEVWDSAEVLEEYGKQFLQDDEGQEEKGNMDRKELIKQRVQRAKERRNGEYGANRNETRELYKEHKRYTKEWYKY